jgi:hypothetical protein
MGIYNKNNSVSKATLGLKVWTIKVKHHFECVCVCVPVLVHIFFNACCYWTFGLLCCVTDGTAIVSYIRLKNWPDSYFFNKCSS